MASAGVSDKPIFLLHVSKVQEEVRYVNPVNPTIVSRKVHEKPEGRNPQLPD